MKKIFCIVFFLVVLAYDKQLLAQENKEPETTKQENEFAQTAKALKVAYITKELNLTEEEAQKFWPVYYNYADELKKARQEFKDDEILFEEKAISIKKKFKESFKRVLNNDDRVKKCFKADGEFRNMIRRELIRRNNMGGGQFRNNKPNQNNPHHPSPPPTQRRF